MTNRSTQSPNQLQNKEAPNGFWRVAKNNVRLRHRSLPVQRVQDRSAFPLSLSQERLWWSEQAYPNSSIQNLQHQLNFTGTLDIDALNSSLREIANRHEILRTTIHSQDGQPIQTISPAIDLELPIQDLQHLHRAKQAAIVQKLALEQAQQPFDLAKGPLWRFLLIRLSQTDHVLLYTVSHIAFDAWSHRVLLRELGVLYKAFSAHQLSPLIELPIQYHDFSCSQHDRLQDDTLLSQLEYWKQQLAGSIPSLDLPTDYRRPSAPAYQPDCQFLTLPETLTQALKTLSSEQGVSLYVTLLSAFKILLYRYTGQTDLLINSPAAGRYQSQTRGLIGCFINTLPIRTVLLKDATFQDLAQQVSQVTEGAFANQDVPFSKLAEVINFSDTSITGALFILQNVPYPVLELPALTISSTYLHRQHGQREPANYFDITLSIHENAGTLTASLAHNAVLFNQATVSRMLAHYQTLLESIVVNPNCRIANLPILTETEQRQLLTEWSHTQIQSLKRSCIRELFEAQSDDREKMSEVADCSLQVYVLDASLELVPVGVPGELYINSTDQSHLNCAELSAEQFISHPFSADPNARLYKTGALAKYRPDGTLEIVGLIDRQIKIRGFRINLADIETALCQHPALNQAVVISQADQSGNKYLVAYVVAKKGDRPNTSELIHFLGQSLPNYMIPAAFVPLETFPLTPNGKIDDAALPALDRAESADSFVAPRIELERQLSEIWSTVLGVRPIGMRDNFFELGGNSLLAVQVVAQIEKTCGYKLSIIDFFRAQTIGRLAALLLTPLLEQEAWSLPWNPLEPVTREKPSPEQSKAPLFILNGGFNQFLAGAIWIAQRLKKEQPCYSLHLRGLDGKQEPHDRVEDMAADAIKGIRTVQPEGPYYLVGLCFGGMVAYEIAQQLRKQGQEVALLVTVESEAPKPKKEKSGFGQKNRAKNQKIVIPTEQFDERTRANPIILKVAAGIYKAITTYEAEPYPGKLTVFQAIEGDKQEQHERKSYLAAWKHLAADVELHLLPGDHMSLYLEENIGTLVDKLRSCLVQARLENR